MHRQSRVAHRAKHLNQAVKQSVNEASDVMLSHHLSHSLSQPHSHYIITFRKIHFGTGLNQGASTSATGQSQSTSPAHSVLHTQCRYVSATVCVHLASRSKSDSTGVIDHTEFEQEEN